jgi:hypothetical protein
VSETARTFGVSWWLVHAHPVVGGRGPPKFDERIVSQILVDERRRGRLRTTPAAVGMLDETGRRP